MALRKNEISKIHNLKVSYYGIDKITVLEQYVPAMIHFNTYVNTKC